jgi:hypothetical protein
MTHVPEQAHTTKEEKVTGPGGLGIYRSIVSDSADPRACGSFYRGSERKATRSRSTSHVL